MSLINSYEKDLLKLNSEKTSILGLIKGLEQIISTYEGNKSKSKNLYQSTYDKYNEVKNKVESLEYELNNEKQTLNTLEKVLNINYNLHVQNEESVRKYHVNLESYQKKLQTIMAMEYILLIK
jgi:chromosome segregation ATPase